MIDSPPSSVTSAAAVPRRWQFDARYIAPLFITLILLIAQSSYGVLESYSRTLAAIGSSIATEIVLSWLVYRKWPHLASAYVSGISVGILLRSQYFWPFALCGALSIASKYVLRLKGRHLWNPSNFGISMLVLLAPQAVATLGIQWGNSLWPMVIVWTLGAFIVHRLHRLHICAAYVAAFVAFAALRSGLSGQPFAAEVAPITGPMYQLFIFFMITDPKSTVLTRRGQVAVAVGVAAMESLLRSLHASISSDISVHAPYYALFLVGPAANLLEIWRTARRPAPPALAAEGLR